MGEPWLKLNLHVSGVAKSREESRGSSATSTGSTVDIKSLYRPPSKIDPIECLIHYGDLGIGPIKRGFIVGEKLDGTYLVKVDEEESIRSVKASRVMKL